AFDRARRGRVGRIPRVDPRRAHRRRTRPPRAFADAAWGRRSPAAGRARGDVDGAGRTEPRATRADRGKACVAAAPADADEARAPAARSTIAGAPIVVDPVRVGTAGEQEREEQGEGAEGAHPSAVAGPMPAFLGQPVPS